MQRRRYERARVIEVEDGLPGAERGVGAGRRWRHGPVPEQQPREESCHHSPISIVLHRGVYGGVKLLISFDPSCTKVIRATRATNVEFSVETREAL